MSMDYSGRDLHIVSFDIPVPVNYGGAIDVYHKLEALHRLGIRIHLHCFQYGRRRAPELEQFCAEVSYYPRIRWPWLHLSAMPFIIRSRQSGKLLRKLLRQPYPILFEGLHTTRWLNHPSLRGRKRIVRTHNIEHHYYRGLATAEPSIWKRWYFRREARKLEAWERRLSTADGIAAISRNDGNHFGSLGPEVRVVSAFHPDDKVMSKEGKGEFALYHGSLDVSENDQAARWLVNEVFGGLGIPLIIAGRKASQGLMNAIEANPEVHLRGDLSSEDIYELIGKAHMNVLPTFQATGIKLKLLAALYRGRHCVVNPAMVSDTGLEDLCIICDGADLMRQTVEKIWNQAFDAGQIDKRKKCLEDGPFSNATNAQRLADMIFG